MAHQKSDEKVRKCQEIQQAESLVDRIDQKASISSFQRGSIMACTSTVPLRHPHTTQERLRLCGKS
ncbi:hypothetical protein KIN20_027869 [Parelaphostrongylus tenuis]|uniref:Uncharacterized protein n=1 Tax=Parelaphostrongylus tenuis TaxID=148309 RepID=A0AAD5R0L3_PARTN|nr:hypothetical protein KIN20_027869 [Parelaphostrongylus tenuis]